MNNLLKKPRLDKVSDGSPAGGMPPVPPVIPKPPEQQPPAETPAPAEGKGSEFDDFGYPKAAPAEAPPKEGEKPKEGDPQPKAAAKEPEEVAEPGTGYGDKAPKVEDAVPPVIPAVPPQAPDDIDKALEGVPKEDALEIKAFAVEHKLTPEVAKAWGDKVKAAVAQNAVEVANMERIAEQQKSQQRHSWYNELKNDKDFGGANFDRNRLQAEKVLQEFMPSTKKELTARGSMLPPYVMRDLAKMGDHLYATERLTQGDPIVPVVPENKKDEALEFYT